MRVVPEREEQADRDRVGVDRGQRVQVERRDLPVRPQTPRDAHAALERYERLGVLGARSVEVRTRLPPQMEEVLEAGRRDECRSRAAPFEKRVRRDRRSVREAVDLGRSDRLGGREHGILLPRAGRHLRRGDLAVRNQHRVGEGAADVDSQGSHARILMPTGASLASPPTDRSRVSASWTASSASA